MGLQRNSAAMSENPFIKKRQRARARNSAPFGLKQIFGLIALSLAAYAAFRMWVGNPMADLCGDNCESMYSVLASVLAFAMMFGAIILAAALVGLMFALLRRRRGIDTSPFMGTAPGQEPPENSPKNQPENRPRSTAIGSAPCPGW